MASSWFFFSTHMQWCADKHTSNVWPCRKTLFIYPYKVWITGTINHFELLPSRGLQQKMTLRMVNYWEYCCWYINNWHILHVIWNAIRGTVIYVRFSYSSFDISLMLMDSSLTSSPLTLFAVFFLWAEREVYISLVQ